MTQQQGDVLSFLIIVVAAAAVCAIVGWMALTGFAVGVITTLGAAALATAGFDIDEPEEWR